MRRFVILLALATWGCAATPALASFSGANGRVALPPFCCEDAFHFVTVTDFASPPVRVSTGAVEFPANIAWSRDGRRVAFDGPATSLGTGRALYIQNADGTGLRQVGRGDRLRYNPAWSPDGTKLAFVQDNGSAGSGDIYTITTSGSNLTRLTTSAGWDGEPDWAGDNSRIAYTCMSGGRRHICQMTPFGGSKTVTTASLGLTGVQSPSWSPSSANIAFTAHHVGEDNAIFRMTRTGGSLRALRSSEDVSDGGPAWSPDARLIAYEEYGSDGHFGIRTINAADGSNPVWIAGNDGPIRLDPGGWQPLP